MAITVNLDNHRRIKMPHFYFYFYFNFNWMCRYISLNKSLHIVFPGDDPRKGYESSNHLLLFLSWNSAMIFTAVISFLSSLLFSTALSLSPMGEEGKNCVSVDEMLIVAFSFCHLFSTSSRWNHPASFRFERGLIFSSNTLDKFYQLQLSN